jgi:hypothetical protein
MAAGVLGLATALLPASAAWPDWSLSPFRIAWTPPEPWTLGSIAGLDLLSAADIGLVVLLLLRRPGWLLVAAGLLIALRALVGAALPIPPAAGYMTGILMTLGAGWLYLSKSASGLPLRWLVWRAASAILAGTFLALTLILKDRLGVLPWLQLLLLALATVASNRAPLVRRQDVDRHGIRPPILG